MPVSLTYWRLASFITIGKGSGILRIIVSGGGTGGHIYPAITIINTIREKCPEAEFLYVGTPHGLEADIVPKEGLPLPLWICRALSAA